MADIKIKLTAAELIYLARQTEGTILPGISDPFQVLNQAERTTKLRRD